MYIYSRVDGTLTDGDVWHARTIPERMLKIIYSSLYDSHETGTSHIVKKGFRIITCPDVHHCESIMPTLMHIYSKNGAGPVIFVVH